MVLYCYFIASQIGISKNSNTFSMKARRLFHGSFTNKLINFFANCIS